MLIDADVTKTIIQPTVTPAFANDEESCGLPTTRIPPRFLSGMEGGNEPDCKDALTRFESGGHGLNHFSSRENISLNGKVYPGDPAGPAQALSSREIRACSVCGDDADLSHLTQRVITGEEFENVLRCHPGFQCHESERTVADIRIGLRCHRSDAGLRKGDHGTDTDNLRLHCDADFAGCRIHRNDRKSRHRRRLLCGNREDPEAEKDTKRGTHDAIRFLMDSFESIGLDQTPIPVMSSFKTLFFSLLGLCASVTTAADKPNILMIAIDDQNDWIGYMGGHPNAITPHIDALAASGTAFTNAHCQSPLCNPSRTSLMLSKRPGSTGIYGLKPWFRDVPELAKIEPLQKYLSRHGYRTYTAGKIYHGGYGRKPGEEWDEIGPPAGGAPFPKEKLVKTPSDMKLVDWGLFPHKDEDKSDYKIASWTEEKLDNMPKDEPFFLSCGFFLPHVPCFATQKWFDLHPIETTALPIIQRDDRKDTPRFSWYLHWKLPEPRLEFLEDTNEWMNLTRSYLACTTFVDDQVRRVMEAVDRNGLRENTIIVLWSDHGWHIGEKEITGKNTLWDDGTRVPLIFAGPGVVDGQICKQPAELLDIYPTLLDLAGLPAKEGVEGISLMPQLKDAATKRDRPAITTHNAGNHGIRSENWRFIIYADGSEELYDMVNDPNEWTNLAGDPKYADVIAEHKKWMPTGDLPPAPNSASRILIYENGKVNWEGEDIPEGAPIPEVTR